MAQTLAGNNTTPTEVTTGSDPLALDVNQIQKDKIVASIDQILSRASKNILNEFEYRYGFLDPATSPLAAYVDELAKKTLGDNYSKVKIYVTKDYPSPNAFALPDGSIVISTELIKLGEYQEALQAVLKHEAVHVVDEHSKKSFLLGLENGNDLRQLTSRIFKNIGLERAQEYSADFTWMVRDCDQSKINPYGAIALFEALERYEENRAPDLAHGMTSDRILNTRCIFYYFPFRYLSAELVKIPQKLTVGVKPDILKVRIESAQIFIKDPTLVRNNQKARLDHVKDLPAKDIVLVLRNLFDQKDEESKSRNAEVIDKLLERVADDYFNENQWNENDPVYLSLWLYLELGSSVNCLWFDKNENLRHLKREVTQSNNLTELISLIQDEATRRFAEFPALLTAPTLHIIFKDTSANDPSNLLKKVVGIQLKSLGLLDVFDPAKASELLNSIQSIAVAAEIFSEECCVMPLSKNKLIKDLAEYVFSFKFQNAEVRQSLRDQLSESLRLTELNSIKLEISQEVPEADINTLNGICSEMSRSVDRDLCLEQGGVLATKNIFMNLLGNLDSSANAITHLQLIAENLIENQLPPEPMRSFRLVSFVAEILNKKVFSDLRPYEKQGLLLAFARSVFVESSDFFDDSNNDQQTMERQVLRLNTEYGYSYSQDLKDSILFSRDKWLEQDVSILDVKDLLRFSRYFPINGNNVLVEEHINTVLAVNLAKYNSTVELLVTQLNLLEQNGIEAREIIQSAPKEFSYVVAKLFANLEVPQTASDFNNYLELAMFIDSPLKRNAFVAFVNSEKYKQSTLEDRLNSIVSGFKHGIDNHEEFRRITEYEICSEDDFRLVRSVTRTNLSQFLAEPSELAGLATIASNFTARNLVRNLDFAKNLIGRGVHQKLREQCLYELLAYDGHGGTADLDANLSYPLTLIQRAITMEESILSLPKLAKGVILRRLLAGQYGLISKPTLRSDFLQHLFVDAVNTGADAELKSIFDDLIVAAPRIRTWEPLYFAFQGLLEPHTLQPSSEVESWSSLAELNHIFGDVKISHKIKEQIDGIRSSQLLQSIISSRTNSPNWRQTQLFVELVNRQVDDFLLLNNVSEYANPYQQIDALDFVIDACQRAGALGVRFLQLIPQFVEIPEAYREKFNKVFDAVEGQSRLAAIYTLEENWNNFWQDVEKVEPGRVGGGSIYSVFKLKMKEDALHKEFIGKTLVVKVRNPNLEFHLDQTYATISEAITAMIEINPKYKVAKLVLDDVYNWIKSEVEYKNYLEQDRIFAEKIKIYNVMQDICEFVVPKSYRVPGTVAENDPNLILIEEYLESDRLTEDFQELEAKGYDMKIMVSQMIKNYFFQLANGMASSDLSIGNYILPKPEEYNSKKQIAIIDRLFFLELDPDLSQFLKPFISTLDILAKDPKEFVDQLVSKFQNQVSQEVQEQAVASLSEFKESLQSGTLSLEHAKQMIIHISKLIPEVSDLVDYMLDLNNLTVRNPDDFINGMFYLADKTPTSEELKVLSEQWSDAKSNLFKNGDMSDLKNFLEKIKLSLTLDSAADHLMSTILNLVGMLTDTDESQLKSLFKLVKNKTITVKEKPFALKEWQKTKVQLKNGNLNALQDFFQSLRSRGFAFNIELTLIFKNLAVLNQMAKTAGFKQGVMQGFGY